MKLIGALLLLVALVSAEYKIKNRDEVIQIRDECGISHHISEEVMEKYKKWEFPDDPKTHCYVKCVIEKMGLFDEQHGMNVEHVHHQVTGGVHVDHGDDDHAKIAKCADKNEQGSSACEWCYRNTMCVMQAGFRLVPSESAHSHDEHHHHH